MTAHYRQGQTVPLEISMDRRALYIPGPRTWYGLTVPSQREAQAEAWLQHRGVYAFHPVERYRATVFSKSVQRERRYLPGYVFIRVKGRLIWHRVAQCIFIRDAIRRSNGELAILHPHDLRKIHAMKARGDEETARRLEHARRMAEQRLVFGDMVRFREGPLEGQEHEVVDIGYGNHGVRLRLFGEYERDVKIDPRTVEIIDDRSGA